MNNILKWQRNADHSSGIVWATVNIMCSY